MYYETQTPKCGADLKLISVIHRQDAIEKILRHVGMWEDDPLPGPAPPERTVVSVEPDGTSYDQRLPLED